MTKKKLQKELEERQVDVKNTLNCLLKDKANIKDFSIRYEYALGALNTIGLVLDLLKRKPFKNNKKIGYHNTPYGSLR